MNHVNLINERPSIMDLSMFKDVKDVTGIKVVLKPKGQANSSRECPETVLEHPHVKKLVDAKWLRYERLGLKAAAPVAAAPPPPPPPAPVVATPVQETRKDETPVGIASAEETPPDITEDLTPAATEETPAEPRRKRR